MSEKTLFNQLRIKKKIFGQNFFPDSNVFSCYEQSKSKQRFHRNFAIAFPTLFECKNWVHEIVLKTAAAEASCCFISMSGVNVEAEMYDTDNKR